MKSMNKNGIPESLRQRKLRLMPLLLAGALAVVGFTVWPGCATPTFTSARKPIGKLQNKDFAFLKSRHASVGFDDLVKQLGQPDYYSKDLRIASYRVNTVTQREFWLFLGILPINVDTHKGLVEVAFVEFDEKGKVQNFGQSINSFNNYLGFEYAARSWQSEQQRK